MIFQLVSSTEVNTVAAQISQVKNETNFKNYMQVNFFLLQ